MGTVIIWGMSVSTIITLYLVPCVYSLMSRFESKGHAKEYAEAMSMLDEL